MNSIGFIGVGELALYTIKGVRRGGYSETIVLGPRNAVKAQWLAANMACEIAADNQSVVDNSSHIVLATRPAESLGALAALRFKPGQVLISVVAGMEIDQLRSVLDTDIDIVRAMPVSSAEVGASPTLIFPAHKFTQQWFNYCGKSIVAETEAYFNQGSVLACVYCWFFSLFDSLIDATQGPSLPPELSAKLVMGMAQAAAELSLASESGPAEIAKRIATDGTFSKLGLDLLNDQSAFVPWRDACRLLQRQLTAND